MSLPTGFLKVCDCGQLIAKSDLRQAQACQCGLVWDGFRKHQAGSVQAEHATLDKSVND